MKNSQVKRMGFVAQMVAVVFLALAVVACDVAGALLGEFLGVIIPVESITDVPKTATVGVPLTLKGTVKPALATKQQIKWSVQSGQATISGSNQNILTASAPGTVVVTAMIEQGKSDTENFYQDCYITVTGGENTFVGVVGINNVPTTATVGVPLTLGGTVMPQDATNQSITWTLRSGSADLNGNTLTVNAAGTVTVTATIANGLSDGTPFSRDYSITVNSGFVPVADISGVPTAATVGMPLDLTGTVTPPNATNQYIAWEVKSGSAYLNGNSLTATASGQVIVTATIANGATGGSNFVRDFYITATTAFVPVTGISNVPGAATVGTPLDLTGTVTPTDATNTTIVWSVASAGTTGASINGTTLTTNAAGTVTVTARIVNGSSAGDYTKNFDITVNSGFVPITDISIGSTTATAKVPFTLTRTVTPSNATNQTTTWTVKSGTAGTTGATISGDTLHTTGAGTVTVTATITNGLAIDTNYTKEFDITVNIVPVTDISNVPLTATTKVPLTLNGTVAPSNATNKTIVWSVANAGTTGATFNGNTLYTTGAGTVVVTATIANGLASGNYTKPFTITVQPEAVTDITGIPATTTVGSLTLNGTVAPSNATNKDIVWSVASAGTTGASISGTNTLITTGTGMVTVTATITNGSAAGSNYIKDFIITVQPVAVTDITGIPTAMTVGSLVLNGTVAPATATNKTIVWSVTSVVDAGATINGNTLNTIRAGTVTVTATIINGLAIGTNYTKEFDITVSVGFVPVTDITGVPTSTTAGTPLNLSSGTVTPATATNQTIAWAVKTAGTTGASINGSYLNTTGSGTVVVTATIANGLAAGSYTKDFTITVQPVAVTGITGIPEAMTVGSLTLNGTVAPATATNKTIAWSVKSAGTTGASISGTNTLVTTGTGTVTITATIANGLAVGTSYTKDFTITVGLGFVPVTDITGVPTTAIVGTALTLTGTVAPSNATNQTITWARQSGVSATVSSSGSFTSNSVGDVVVRATIANGKATGSSYTKDFTITVQPVAVTDITGVATTATVGINLNLNNGMAVVPTNATNRTIAWSVASAGTTGATISLSTLSTTGTGTVTVTATITNGLATGTNYTKNFDITVQPIAAAFSNFTANGSSGGTSTTTTTQLTLTFDKNITDLAAGDITLSPGTTGAVKGALTKATPTGVYYLAVSGITSGGEVTVTVTKPNYTFTPASRTVTVHARGTLTPLTITFNQIADQAPSITGPTIYRVSNGGPTSATITVENPTQYDSISWRVQDTTVTGTGASFTLSAANTAYNLIGDHFVTVMVMKGGVPYNKTVSFKVEY